VAASRKPIPPLLAAPPNSWRLSPKHGEYFKTIALYALKFETDPPLRQSA
jgi:hypothetical protein